jgi:hypothetical protein
MGQYADLGQKERDYWELEDYTHPENDLHFK